MSVTRARIHDVCDSRVVVLEYESRFHTLVRGRVGARVRGRVGARVRGRVGGVRVRAGVRGGGDGVGVEVAWRSTP